jgi:hypothetical protein
MKINKVYIKHGIDERTFEFSNNINLIFSSENSKGKTTLLRLYAPRRKDSAKL